MKKRTLAVLLAMLLVLTALPTGILASAIASAQVVSDDVVVPEGYNENDYLKLRAIFEIEDADGIKNGAKVSSNYDPDVPETWVSPYDLEWLTVDGENRLYALNISCYDYSGTSSKLCGTLDLSYCSELISLEFTNNQISDVDFTGCIKLRDIYCSVNLLTEIDISSCEALYNIVGEANAISSIDVSHNPDLGILDFNDNLLTELDVSCNPALVSLYCMNNNISELDLSHNPELNALSCGGNLLTELDLSHNELVTAVWCDENQLTELDLSANAMIEVLSTLDNPMESIRYASEGRSASHPDYFPCDINLDSTAGGYVGIIYNYYYHEDYGHKVYRIEAKPSAGYSFVGWYDIDGNLMDENASHDLVSADIRDMDWIARFEPDGSAIPGDANGDGVVDTSDAVLVMRHALSLTTLSDEAAALCDMNGDGEITILDATLIMRAALGF